MQPLFRASLFSSRSTTVAPFRSPARIGSLRCSISGIISTSQPGAPILGHGRQDTRARHQGWRRQAQSGPRLEAELVIDRWNRRLATGRDMLWSPTIRATLIAGTPWLDVLCPGCGTSRAIDLQIVDRHPLASVGTMVLGLRCSWCLGSAPLPKLLGLYAWPPARGRGTLSFGLARRP
jgi:hypothetical protein